MARRPSPTRRQRRRNRPAQDRRDQPRLRITHPSDFIAAVPYLLGFHPTESIVVVLLRDGRVRLTFRMDLPAEADAELCASYIHQVVTAQHGGDLMLLGYSRDLESARAVMSVLAAQLRSADLLDALLVGPDRWWSLTCQQPCCPAEGAPYDVSSHPIAAEATLAGLVVLGDRAELAASVRGPAPEELPALRAVAETIRDGLDASGRSERQHRMEELVQHYLDAPHELSEADCLRLALLGLDVHVRDVAWAMMSREQADRHVDLWRQVVARALPELSAAPLCLLGMAAWISGNGGLLNCCAERLSALQPDYSMLQLLIDISERAVPPTVWDELAGEMRAQLRPLAG